ncbi:hypothetical protein PARHAE_02457 [Paracoccus haematequi]|uniref:Tc1-like transposase DDE domain-containing protein n=1 Tax=Paracoccus haematequi TaxID=2491866 RepID=A0A447IP77_9RHOB|nr:IS630 family transposase [Paracoccus haematequi]VDS09260.1 hypothetical protein PARHAE_02457 [Paracoccus haematequi]
MAGGIYLDTQGSEKRSLGTHCETQSPSTDGKDFAAARQPSNVGFKRRLRNTQTFIAALRHDRLDAPWVINGAMNRELFELYVETQLAPTLRPGDVIILDNLSSHKSPKAAATMNAVGAWFLFLPPYSPDLNPIEMAFAKLKALIRRAAARTYEALWHAVGQVCDLFTDEECYNFFKAAGYETD